MFQFVLLIAILLPQFAIGLPVPPEGPSQQAESEDSALSSESPPVAESTDAGAAPKAQDVTFPGAGEFELQGTLLLPAGAEEIDIPLPGMLLLPGSGPTNRNGSQPPMYDIGLLKQIAEHLADRGVATLRFDKRASATYADRWPDDSPEALNEFFAWDHFVEDAESALNYLRQHPAIDAGRIMIFGHSEGGLIALTLSARQREAGTPVQGLILAGTPGRRLDVVVREQLERMLDLGGLVAERKAAMLAEIDTLIRMVKEEQRLPEEVMPGLRPLFNPTVINLLHAYFTIEPLELARDFKGPVLVLNGDNDSQISAVRDARRLEIALHERRPRGLRHEVVILPNTSHNLKRAEAMHAPGMTGPVVPEALETIEAWVKRELLAETDDPSSADRD